MGLLLSKVLRPVKLVSEYVQTEEVRCLAPGELLRTPSVQILKDSLLDPRSVTSGIKRTPLVIITEQCETTGETPKTRHYLETDIDAVATPLTSRRKELSAPSSPELLQLVCGRESEKKSIEVYEEEEEVDVEEEEEEEVEEEEGDRTPEKTEESFEGEERRAETRSSLEELRRRLFLTPDLSKDVIRLKSGRTPLGVVSSNVMKPWKGLDEERRKLGLENTPPPSAQPALSDTSQSAPGKVFRSRTNWDHNSSFVI